MNLQTPERKLTINCKGTLISLETPKVMGILNITPDSFFEGSRVISIDYALRQAEKMLHDGATFIDVGGYSSRPGASDVAVDEELRRVIPVISHLSDKLPQALISIDTFRAKVAKEAIDAGASIVNDIASGEDDAQMMSTVAGYGNVPYIVMHKLGTAFNMQKDPQYKNVVTDLLDYFTAKVFEARDAGILDIIIDPGFGFGKTLEHNYTLLKRLGDFGIFGLPILAGISRKKMVQRIAGVEADGALNATSAANTVALINGASILRVHDVKEAMECIKIVNAINGNFQVL